MGTRTKTLSFSTTAERRTAVEQYQQREGYDTKTDALEELVAIGLRESRYPVLHRWKTQATNWAGQIGLMSLVVVIAGFLTDVVTPVHGLQIALVMLTLACVLWAAVELARTATGQSALGQWLREEVR
jgi:hypothetical protein